MYRFQLLRRLGLFLVCAAWLAPQALGGDAPTALCGRLSEKDGLPILELWGSREQAAYAHGYLMADRILLLFDEYVLSPTILRDLTPYHDVIRPAARRDLDWGSAEGELRAILEGMKAKLGPDGLRSKKLGRALDLDDLLAANALADWSGLFCSTFTVWGGLTSDGQPLTARNLDYDMTDTMARLQIALVYRVDDIKEPWVGVTWPGLVGVYTGMNRDGVAMLMHDADAPPAPKGDKCAPRSLILREALECASAMNWADDVKTVFSRRHVLVGNNVHVSGPMANGRPPAVVFEYDGATPSPNVTIRTPENGVSAIWCTNHMCARRSPPTEGDSLSRFSTIGERIAEATRTARKLDVEAAFAILDAVKKPYTLHSVVMTPATRHISVRATNVTNHPVALDVGALLQGK